jgi:hypothetical protein
MDNHTQNPAVTLSLDCRPLNLTDPSTWGNAVTIAPNGFIESKQDGVVTRIEPLDVTEILALKGN